MPAMQAGSIVIASLLSLYFLCANLQVGRHRVQVNIYCKSKMTSQPNSGLRSGGVVPVESLVRSLDRPEIKPLLKDLNVTAFGVRVRRGGISVGKVV